MRLQYFKTLVVTAVLLTTPSGYLSSQQSGSIPVTLQVTDTAGAVIPGAQVILAPSSADLPPDLHTDRYGSFAMALRPGSYNVSVHYSGFFPLTKEIQVRNTSAQTFQFALHIGSCPPGPCPVVMGAPLIIPETSSLSKMIEEQPAGSLTIKASGPESKTIDLAALKAMPHKTISFHNVHTNADETYSGVPLIDLLASLGMPHGKDLHGKALSDYVVATGSDGYKAVLALAEVDPEFHPGDVIVADAMDGKPLDAQNGPFKLVVTEDKRPARSVHNLVSIEVKTAE